MVGVTGEIKVAKMWPLSTRTVSVEGEDGMYLDAFYIRGGKRCYEMQPQEQSGNHPMNPFAFTWFPQANNIFGTSIRCSEQLQRAQLAAHRKFGDGEI